MPTRFLFICGSINQTTQMHKIASCLPEGDAWFTPFYADGVEGILQRGGLAENTVLGQKLRSRCLAYLHGHDLQVDDGGHHGSYDLVVTCTDLVVPHKIRSAPIVLVQEGMTDPESVLYQAVRYIPFFPRWLAGTAATGLSNAYDRFCVASHGYRDLFIRKGVHPDRLVVTGIPNFDNCEQYYRNSFPHKGYVLVCTSDMRETFKFENRKKLIQRALRIADGRQLIFKLHPNENPTRARSEILRYAPDALVFSSGSAEEMVANCDVLITTHSTTVFVGLALGKECYSDFPMDELRALVPDQNHRAAENIASICREVLAENGNTSKQIVLPDPQRFCPATDSSLAPVPIHSRTFR